MITTLRDIEAKAGRIAETVAAVGRDRPLDHVAVSLLKATDDIEADVHALKPRIVVTIQSDGPELSQRAGFEVNVPPDRILLPDGTDMGHPCRPTIGADSWPSRRAVRQCRLAEATRAPTPPTPLGSPTDARELPR